MARLSFLFQAAFGFFGFGRTNYWFGYWYFTPVLEHAVH
jgi:hypothetical protein